MPKLIFHGHAVWEVTNSKYRLLIDPFLTGNERADVGPEAFDALDAILVTHGHWDHIGDVENLAKKTDALIVSTAEIAGFYEKKGCRTHGMNIGGAWHFDFGRVKFTNAEHGSVGPNGEALGHATGIILTMDGKKIYNAGDTGIFSDMKLITELNGPFDVAILPIGDNFTMGIDDAAKAAEFVDAKLTIPQHYGTFPLIDTDPTEFARKVEAQGRKVKIMEPGEALEIA